MKEKINKIYKSVIEKLNKNLIAVAIIIAGILIAGTVLLINKGKIGGFLTAEQAGEKTMNFINENLLEQGQGLTASLLNVERERGLYRINFQVGEENFESYVTRDGRLFFFEGIDMERGVSDTPPDEQGQGQEQGNAEPEESFSAEQLESLAKCLTERGARFYGAYWCGFCTRQKEMFGEFFRYITYIECAPDRATPEQIASCEAAEIGGVPDWRFQDGNKVTGLQSIRELSRLSGCPL